MGNSRQLISWTLILLCVFMVAGAIWTGFTLRSGRWNQADAALSVAPPRVSPPPRISSRVQNNQDQVGGTSQTVETLSLSIRSTPQPVALAAQQVSSTDTPTPASAPAEPLDGVYTLPFTWDGADTVSEKDVATVAPPLQVVEATGGFSISRVKTGDEESIRILLSEPITDGQSTPGLLHLVWSLPDEANGVALPANRLVSVSMQARAYSPPRGVQLGIWERQEDWTSSSANVDGIDWTEYDVTRQIDPDTREVYVGLRWELPSENAWMEFKDLTVTVHDESEPVTADQISPNDTPTPVPTPMQTNTPIPLPTATWTPLVVTETPFPVDLFAVATLVAKVTAEFSAFGPATATPENLVTATHTPVPIVVTNTPTPANQATAVMVALRATALAFTTGTPTPYPTDAVVLLATPTPSQTPTPIFVYVEDIPATVTPSPTAIFPNELVDKIMFLGDSRGRRNHRGDILPDVHMMNPDGSGLAILTSRLFYDRARERDAFSSDKRFRAFALREEGLGQGGNIQLYVEDAHYQTVEQMTFFGAGTAWAPTWSPRSDRIAFVSSESRNDEIWLVNRGEWPAVQLTKNDWEWDKHPSWSPDGSQIIFSSNRGSGINQLWIMDPDGSNVRPLTNFPWEAWDPVWVKYPDS